MKRKFISVGAAVMLLLFALLLSSCSAQSFEPEDIAPQDVPASLQSFLFRFTDWYEGTSYDRSAPEGCLILKGILSPGSVVDMSLYPDANPIYHWDDEETDPRGWCDTYNTGFIEYDRAAIDDIASKVFGLSRKQIDEQVRLGEQNEYFYIDGDKYYTIVGGVGDPPTSYKIVDAKYDGRKYYVYYDCYFDTGDSDTKELLDPYFAVAEPDSSSGEGYWSLVSMKRLDSFG